MLILFSLLPQPCWVEVVASNFSDADKCGEIGEVESKSALVVYLGVFLKILQAVFSVISHWTFSTIERFMANILCIYLKANLKCNSCNDFLPANPHVNLHVSLPF